MKAVGTRPKSKLGLPGYARILARVHKTATMADLMQEGYVASFSAAHVILAGLHRNQRIYIAEWQMPPKCPLRAAWKYGSADDATPPEFRPSKKGKYRAGKAYVPHTRLPLPLSMLCFEDLLCALDSAKTVYQLMRATELAEATVRHTLRELMPLLSVGKSGRSVTYQLREATRGVVQKPRIEAVRVASVFDLACAANDARQAA